MGKYRGEEEPLEKGLGGGRGHLPKQPSASRGMGSIGNDAFHAPLKQRLAAVVPL